MCCWLHHCSSGVIDTSESVDDDYVDHKEAKDTTTADDCDASIDNNDTDSQSTMLLIFYDCESMGGRMYDDHIIEVGAKVVTAPGSADISQLEYSSLIHSSCTIVKALQSKCDITAQMLVT